MKQSTPCLFIFVMLVWNSKNLYDIKLLSNLAAGTQQVGVSAGSHQDLDSIHREISLARVPIDTRPDPVPDRIGIGFLVFDIKSRKDGI